MKRFQLLSYALLLTFMQLAVANPTEKKQTKFTVRVENISVANSQTASDGTQFSFALSPGLWVLNEKKAGLFVEGQTASKALESQSEDGDPSGLAAWLMNSHHASSLHGIFNTPEGMTSPGPIRPGDSYEYNFTATPGMKLFTTMMFGQSNDWFYAPDANGIALFDGKGNPITGDVTEKLILWNAGTEVDEEIGIGPNQGPRQKGINTGVDEHGVVRRVQDARWTGKNAEFFRVTVNAEAGM